MPFETILADPIEIRFRDNPGRPARRAGIEREEVGPGGMEDETDAVSVDDLDRLHPLVQQLGRSPLVAQEAESHILGGERIAVVEGQALTQLEFIGQPVLALRSGFRQTSGHIVAHQGFDQRVMQGVGEHERRGDSSGIGRTEIGGGDHRERGPHADRRDQADR